MANQTVTVLEADGLTQTDVEVLGFGRQAAAASKSTAMSTEDKAVFDALATKLDTCITALQIIDNMVLAAGTNNIGDVDVLTVPTDPFGANADAASLTTSISAKLKGIATALGITALDLGVGTGGSRTLRMALDTASQNANGQATMANSAPVVLASNQASIPVASTLTAETTKVIGTINVAASQTIGITNTPLTNFGAGEYETVAASQTAQALGAVGATGDYISGVLVVPATTSPGNVLLLDNATSITVFAGGATSVSNLVPFFIPLGMISVSGAWKITTGANVSCIGIGNFT